MAAPNIGKIQPFLVQHATNTILPYYSGVPYEAGPLGNYTWMLTIYDEDAIRDTNDTLRDVESFVAGPLDLKRKKKLLTNFPTPTGRNYEIDCLKWPP